MTGKMRHARASNKLTDKAVSELQSSGRPYKVADGLGLHILVSTAGGRLWRLSVRHDGKQRTIALGRYPALRTTAARQMRDQLLRSLTPGVAWDDVAALIKGEAWERRERYSYHRRKRREPPDRRTQKQRDLRMFARWERQRFKRRQRPR